MATISEIIQANIESIALRASKSNGAGMLFELHKWQEAKSIAERRLKEAWTAAQSGEFSFIADDDKLRKKKLGTHVVSEGGKFSVVVKVSAGDTRFDPAKFKMLARRRFKLTDEQVTKLIEDSKVQGKPKIEKRVLEGGIDG